MRHINWCEESTVSGMSKADIKWAAEHDWFVKADGRTVVVNDVYYNVVMKKTYHNTKSFDSIARLKEWAGY